MRKFFLWLARDLTADGRPCTPVQAAEAWRASFGRMEHFLVRNNWPIPETDEGKLVCMCTFLEPLTRR